MADDHDCSRSGLDMGPSGLGQVTDFPSAARELRNRESHNDAATSSTGERTCSSTAPQELWTEPLSKDLGDATTSSTGEHTYYSTAPQELWTEVLSKDLEDLNFVGKTQNKEGESSCVEVLLLEPSDLVLEGELAEGGQAHVYFAKCVKFPMPVVVKRLKNVNVDLFRLQGRMERVMKLRKKNDSAICRVLGVGEDVEGNACVVMQRMDGDLRTIINRVLPYQGDWETPFGYSNVIAMMMDVAQGMKDLHSCGLIHADLKASNILVYTIFIAKIRSLVFLAKIGDFDTSDGIWGTGFWRAPEVLQSLQRGGKPTILPSADVYSYGMLCYEILSGEIPFSDCARSDYNVVISGQRPQLPAHVTLRMKELVYACWRANPQDRPGWTWIIETLKNEQMKYPLDYDRSQFRLVRQADVHCSRTSESNFPAAD